MQETRDDTMPAAYDLFVAALATAAITLMTLRMTLDDFDEKAILLDKIVTESAPSSSWTSSVHSFVKRERGGTSTPGAGSTCCPRFQSFQHSDISGSHEYSEC